MRITSLHRVVVIRMHTCVCAYVCGHGYAHVYVRVCVCVRGRRHSRQQDQSAGARRNTACCFRGITTPQRLHSSQIFETSQISLKWPLYQFILYSFTASESLRLITFRFTASESLRLLTFRFCQHAECELLSSRDFILHASDY